MRDPEPCVILLDLHLLRYEGIAILRAIHEAPALKDIQVLMLSGQASPREEDEISRGGGFYRRKPSTLNELSELAAEIFAICNKSSSSAMSA